MKMILFLTLGVLLPHKFFAQTAREIVQKHLEKTGGYPAWNSLNTVQLEGTITLGIKDVYPIKIFQKRPNFTLSVIQINGKKVILEGYNGKRAIQTDFYTGKTETIPNYSPENFDSDLLGFQSRGFTVSLEGKEKIENTLCFKVVLTKFTNKTTYYFSTENYYLLKEINPKETLLYSQFKNINGLVFPFQIEGIDSKGQTEFLLKLSRISTNQFINPELFNW